MFGFTPLAGHPAPGIALHPVHGRRFAAFEAASYVTAVLIALAIAPALFIALDHDVVARWSNTLIDLVSRP